MSNYTSIFIDVDIKKAVPSSIIELLMAICEKNADLSNLSDEKKDFRSIFRKNSLQSPNTSCAVLSFEESEGVFSFIAKGNHKNEALIDSFIPRCEL